MPSSKMRIPNAANSRLMGTRRIRPFRRSGGGTSGPKIVTAPVIAGTVLPNEILTLTQQPVWDGTETSSSWVWTADGVEIAGSTDAVTITVPTSNIAARYRVVATAANAEGTSVIRSNQLLLEAPVLETPLVNQSFEENTGIQTYDVSGNFSTSYVETYGITPSIAGVSIDENTGIITFDTDVLDVQAGTTFTVTATNAAGSADGTFDLEITVEIVAPVLETPLVDQSFEENTGIQTYDVSGNFSGTEPLTYSIVATDLVMTFETTAANETITIPHQNNGVFDYTVSSPTADASGQAGQTVTAFNDANRTLTFPAAGTHTVTCAGTMPNIYFNNGGDVTKLRTVENLGQMGWTRLNDAFYGAANMTLFNGAGDVSGVTTMHSMFRGTADTIFLNLGTWDTGMVTTMHSMFRTSSYTIPPDVGQWDVSSVIDMTAMFDGNPNLTTPPDVSQWNTSSVTTMRLMFTNCSALLTLPDVSGWDTGNVGDIRQMFEGLANVIGAPAIAGWDVTALGNGDNFIRPSYSPGQLSTEWYNDVLTAWEAQNLTNSGVPINFGYAVATGAGLTARQALIDDHGWVISDGTAASGITGGYILTVGQDGNRTGYARNSYGAMDPDTAGVFNIGRFIVRDSGQIIFRLRNYDDTYTGDVLVEYDGGQTELLAYQGAGEWSGFNLNLEAYLQANVGNPVQINLEAI